MQHPKQLGPFRITKQLGRGGMGAVYQGEHVTTGEPVAVKMLLDHFDESPEVRKRFEAEIEALRMLRHPNIVRLNGFGQEEHILFYVMELVCGTTLQKELKHKRGFFWQDVAKIGYEVCLALKHGHDRGIVHRDLKPGNIMLDHSGTVKIADYGIAQCFGGNRLTGSNAVIGTIEFMSPEQTVADVIGPKSDLYSLGAVLYSLLCRRPPYMAKSLPEIIKKHTTETIEEITQFRHDAPKELCSIIRHLLERQIEKRPNSAYHVTKRFEALLDSEFGSPDAVIVLPSRFDEPALPIKSNNNPQESEENETVLQESRHHLPKGDSSTFVLNLDSKITTNAGDVPGQSASPSPDNNTDQESLAFSQISRYHDLTSLGTNPGNDTRHTMAFDFLKSGSGNVASEPVNYIERIDTDAKEALNLTSYANDSTVVASLENEEKSHKSTFTTVREEELGQYRPLCSSDDREAPLFSVQVAVLSICMIVFGLLAWFMLQPPKADMLYNEISRAAAGTSRIPDAVLLANEEKMRQFLKLYPGDARTFEVQKYINEVDMIHMDRAFERRTTSLVNDQQLLPVHRAYIEAISYVNHDPDKAIERLEQLIDLYDIPQVILENNVVVGVKPTDSIRESDMSNPNAICVELAKRRLETLKNALVPANEIQLEQLHQLLNRADQIESQLPEKAKKMRQSLIELYQNKKWAEPALERARQSLQIENIPAPSKT